MVDPPHVIMGVQHVPPARFVGVNDRTHRARDADHRDGRTFLADHDGERPAPTLTHDHHDLALAGLLLG